MTLDYEERTDQEHWELAVKNVAEILKLDKDKVGNYLVLAYDGTPELKADTDVEDIPTITALLVVFLEHVSGKGVILTNEDGSRYTPKGLK